MGDGTEDLTPRQGRVRRNPVISQRIGANIRRAREAKGYTQAMLAQLIGEAGDFGDQTISRWERGAHRPSDDTLERLAEVLDVAGLTYFFEIHEEPEEAAA